MSKQSYRPTGGVMVHIEQAIARGETLEQICDNLGVEPKLVDRALRRMDAAVNPVPAGRPRIHGTRSGYDQHRTRGEDPCDACQKAVDARCAARRARYAQTHGQRAPRNADEIRRLAAYGLLDREIGDVLDLSSSGVATIRHRYGIPAGNPPGRRAG